MERWEFFRAQVQARWGGRVATTLALTLENSPEDGNPTLVVWAVADMAPDEHAEGTSALFRGQYERFGLWLGGIGFAWVIQDTGEDR